MPVVKRNKRGRSERLYDSNTMSYIRKQLPTDEKKALVTDIMSKYGVSRPTAYRWIRIVEDEL